MADEDDASAAPHALHGDAEPTSIAPVDEVAPVSTLCATAEDIRAYLGDAEDASADFLVDLVDDIFAGMRVNDENETCLRAVVSHAWQQVMGGCIMAAADARESLDADALSSNTQRKQFVRPRIASSTDDKHTRQRRQPTLNQPHAPVVPFLVRLWTLVDRQRAFVEQQLACFPSAKFHVSAIPTRDRTGEWEIPVDDLSAFLRRVAHAAKLSVLGSAVVFVVHVNATLLAKKRKARAKLQLHHIALCVQTALLEAEESEAAYQKSLSATATQDHVFQTEVGDGVEISGHQDEWLVCYWDETGDPTAAAIDRNATGSVSSKRELSADVVKKQKLARNVVFSLLQQQQQRRDSTDTTKWGALRKRVLVQQDQHVGIAVEADMALGAVGASAQSEPRKKRSSTVASPTQDSMTARLSPHKMSILSGKSSSSTATITGGDPDAAALSNIFSLGTPRQLSADELARRNDILSLLEREEAQVSRRMAVASIASASIPPPCTGPDGKPIASDTDKAFQDYVAANSSITTTKGSCHVPAATISAEERSPNKTVNQPPTEPRGGGGQGGGGKGGAPGGGRTKFDLALEAPRFDVVEGNSHIRMAAEAAAAAAAAAASASRKSKSRGVAFAKTAVAVSPLLHAPSPPTSPPSTMKSPQPPALSPQHNTHLRPLETASGQLPQLDTSRLAVGVKAVVRGVEKRGPRHDPSRNSRLRLHNYVTSAEEESAPPVSALSPVKPPTTTSNSSGTGPGAHLPPVSPVKASPHRKHVAFPPSPVETLKSPQKYELSPQRPQPPIQASESPIPPNGSRRFPAKQPAFENRTSPPRVRNRHLTEYANNPTAKHKKRRQFGRHASSVDDDDDGDGDPHELTNHDSQALRAPRRDLAHTKSVLDTDDE